MQLMPAMRYKPVGIKPIIPMFTDARLIPVASVYHNPGI